MNTNKVVIRMGFSFRFGNEIIYEDSEDEYLIEMEEETFDVCKPEMTNHPRDSVRLISYAFGDFIEENLPTIYSIFNQMCEERKGHMIVPVSSIIDEINNLKPEAPEGEECPGLHGDRVRWFQYWAAKCIDTYGDEAKFSVS